MKRLPSLILLLLVPASLFADPSEDHHAWPGAPTGFHWERLGRRTEAVSLTDYSAVVHVSGSGSDERGDGSANRPLRTLARALASAAATGRTAVLVAAGRYQEPTLALRERVDLFGGFHPQTWQRDIAVHATIVSGAGVQRVFLGANDCRVDGFIIEDGRAEGHGGALLCDGTSPVITNNVFRRNHAAAPAKFPPDPDRRRIRGHDGGAIALLNYANADIRHNLFHDNSTGAGYGGAICAAHDSIAIIGHNVFWGNRAGIDDKTNSRSSNGGAVALLFSARPALMHNLFIANATLGDGDGGAVFMEYFCWPEVRNNAFVHNRSDDDGGALDHQKFSYPKIRANLFYGNTADKSGGALHSDDSAGELENNIFAYNRAKRQGGAIGMTHGWMRVVNNTLAFNDAGLNGGGIHTVNVKNPFLRVPIFRNNLLASNQPGPVHFDHEVDAAYNIMHPEGFKGGYYNFAHAPGFRDDGRSWPVNAVRSDEAGFTTQFSVSGQLTPGELTGRIARVGAHWSMVRGNEVSSIILWGPAPSTAESLEILPTFRLAANSKAIDAGAHPDFPPVDIDGEPRAEPNIDIGADEFYPTPQPR